MPPSLPRTFLRILTFSFLGCALAVAEEGDAHDAGLDRYFRDEVWAKVAAQNCLKCHKAGGDAEDTKLVFQDPARDPHPERFVSFAHNRAAFAKMAAKLTRGESRLLLKATGDLDHEGEEVVKPDSLEYRILEEFVRRLRGPSDERAVASDKNAPPFFEGIAMLDDRRLLRRATLSLAGRLPRAEEMTLIEKRGLPALDGLLDAVMKEEAFYERLAEAFNDILLVRGYGEEPLSALPYNQFEKTRLWNQKHDLSAAGDKKAQEKARYKLTDNYYEALRREPFELIKYIVREERPFTEIVTADYTVVSPYTARGYGNFEELRGRFRNVDDPFEYIPVRLAALKHREKGKEQISETGFYPHAGMLGSFQYLRRFPTTETNRNRLRGRMYYEHFLGVDVLELAARVSDAAAVTAKFEIPTMQAAECVVCHKTLDPVAGLFQDFYNFDGVFGPRKEGWYEDMFGPGFEGEDMPPEQKWRALQWLGERTAKDPRFATTMVEHVYYILTGRRALRPPKALDDPLFDARQRAYAAQRLEINAITARFVKANFNLKVAFKAWAASQFYRADGVTTALADPKRKVELDDLGIARILSPEQLERKIIAVFGKRWGRLDKPDNKLDMLYGGIDSDEVTERATDPSGAMGAIQRTMANEVACKNVASDFALAPEQRRLFPKIEPGVLPGESAENDQRIHEAIAHLHQHILGRFDAADSSEVRRTFDLLAGIVADAHERKDVEDLENYHCRVSGEGRVKDPEYTVRAWRGVVTYLLRQREFLYE